jgi:hypothetical protein
MESAPAGQYRVRGNDFSVIPVGTYELIYIPRLSIVNVNHLGRGSVQFIKDGVPITVTNFPVPNYLIGPDARLEPMLGGSRRRRHTKKSKKSKRKTRKNRR